MSDLSGLVPTSAIRLDASAVLTYDRRLGEAARAAGLDVIAPAEPLGAPPRPA